MTQRCIRLATLGALAFAVSACGTARGGASSTRRPATTKTTTGEPFGRFASLRSAAASISRDCAKTPGSGLPPQIAPLAQGEGSALWLPTAGGGPLVYSANVYDVPVTSRKTAFRFGAFSSRGLAVRLPISASVGGESVIALWPCRPPVLVYYTEKWIRMKALARSPRQQTTRTLVNGAALNGRTLDSEGQVLQAAGKTIRYPDGTTVAPRGLPTGAAWRIEYIAPSPRNPHVLVAEVYDTRASAGGPRTGRLYLITPRATTFLHFWDIARGNPVVEWSADGSKFLWDALNAFPERGASLYVSDSQGRHRRRLVNVRADLRSALWSPDGTEIAYTAGVGFRPSQVGVADVASGVVHQLTHLHWMPPRPPRPSQPPSAHLLAWSPDGRSVAVFYAAADNRRAVIEAIPATGGPPHVLIRLPRYKGPPLE